ncbi:MAG: phage tail tape measure protein [Lachnospiraceae bacterium]|nr:phage tail tape measure protein [Lachnospiraceae bacterium]
MAGNTIKGITIEIGGDTTKLDKALGGVNQKVRNTQVELREVNKLLKMDPTNTEALAQKQTLLSDAISSTKEKLDILKKAESQVQEQFQKGEVSEEQYRALKREIEKTRLELDGLEKAAFQTDTAIEELGKKAKLSGEELENAKDKATTFSEKLDGLGEKAKATTAAMGAGFVAAATYVTNFESECDKALNTVITQTGAADTEVEGLEKTLLNIYKNNFGEDINDIALAMSNVKQQTGFADEELQKTTETAILMRDTFDLDVNEGIRGVNAMMKQFGITAEEAYNLLAQGAQKGLNQNGDLADQLAEYATYYADLGITAEEAFNMMANGVKSGTFQLDYLNDAVKEFGIRVKDGTADDTFKALSLDADELKKKFAEGGEGAREAFTIVNNALFACEDDVQRNILGVTLYGTKWEDLGEDAVRALINTQGEISSTNDALKKINDNKYNDIGNQITELGRSLKTDLVKPIGEELQPVISEVIGEVKSKIPQIKTIVLSVIEKVKDFIAFVSKNGATIIAIIAGIAAGMLAWNVVTMIQGLIAAFQVWKTTTDGVTIAQKLLNTAMKSNPIGIVITIVAALVAALITLFATNEEFRTKVIAVWEKVKAAFSDMWLQMQPIIEQIKTAFNNLLVALQPVFEFLVTYIGAMVNGIISAAAPIMAAVQNVINFVTNIISAFTALMHGDFDGFFMYLEAALQNAISFAQNIIMAAINYIVGFFAGFGVDIKQIFIDMWNKIVEIFQGIGPWFVERWTEIKMAFANVGTWFGTQFQNAWANIRNAFANVVSFFSGLWEKIKGCFVNIGVQIGTAVGDAFKNAINSVLSTIEGIVNNFIGMINGVIDIINEIPGVSLSPIGMLELPRLAKGGVLREGTAMVAEAGPELLSMVNGKAVVTPLTGSARNQALENVGNSGGNYNQTINVISPKALSAFEVARQTRLQTRSMILAMRRR